MHYRRVRLYGDPDRTTARRTDRDGGDYRVARRQDGTQDWAHIVIAERALGRPLPTGVQVHHVDYDRSNNAPGNLVICPSAAYHKLLHVRTDALNACGHPDWRKCKVCHRYDALESLVALKDGGHYHRQCNTEYYRRKRAELMAATAA
jgi:hypothetical protein